MTIPVYINYSPDLEARRLAFTIKNVANGWYANQGFAVLPRLEPRYSEKIVVVPKLDYQQIINVQELLHSLPTIIPCVGEEYDVAVSKLLPLLEDHSLIADQLLAQTLDEWREYQTTFWEMLKHTFSFDFGISKLVLYPTMFGTNCSFRYLSSSETEAHIHVRFDATLATLIESILSSRLHRKLELEQGLSWLEREVVIDALTTYIRWGVEPKHAPQTAKRIRNPQLADAMSASKTYVNSLGFSKENKWTIKDGAIQYADTIITGLSKSQQRVLLHLVQQGKLTQEELAKCLWASDEKFSPWAIAKQIQRLREVLETNGIRGYTIQAKRGVGYVLV
jgi:hypothetical protein